MIVRHTTITWAVAHAIHFILMVVWGFMPSRAKYDIPIGEILSGAMIVFVLGILTSLPSFIVFGLIGYLLIKSPFSGTGKFMIWLFAAPLTVLGNGWLLLWSLSDCSYYGDLSAISFCFDPSKDLIYFLPAVIATLLSVVFRCRQFLKLAKSHI